MDRHHPARKRPATWLAGMIVGILIGVSAAGASEPATATPTEVSEYLERALDLMQEHSMNREHIDWAELRLQSHSRASAARDSIDTYAAIRFALGRLGDRHSFLQLSPELAERERERRGDAASEPETPADGNTPSLRREMDARTLGRAPIGYVAVPSTAGWKMQEFADTLHDGVRKAAAADPCGWIIDLRGNGGGNMWPMLAGIGPLIGKGRFGSFVGPEGTTGHWFYEAGRSGIERPDGSRQMESQITDQPLSLESRPPVAVLIGGGVGSSGEAIAIAFKGRPDTRFFGSPTYGIPTSNRGFRLPDGANLVITVGTNADRTGKPYLDSIAPDVVTEGRWDRDTGSITVEAATNWLLQHPNCSQAPK